MAWPVPKGFNCLKIVALELCFLASKSRFFSTFLSKKIGSPIIKIISSIGSSTSFIVSLTN